MRLRRIARPLARKGLSVIAAFLLSQFPNFLRDLEQGVTPVEIAADRNRSMAVVESQKALKRKSTSRLLDPPARPFPIGIAQAALEYLAGIFARQVGLDLQMLRYLVVGERRLQPAADIGNVEGDAGLWFHHRHQRLAEFVIGDAEHRAIMHAGHRMQRGLDL